MLEAKEVVIDLMKPTVYKNTKISTTANNSRKERQEFIKQKTYHFEFWCGRCRSVFVVRACKDGDVLTITAVRERERDGAWQSGDSTGVGCYCYQR